MVLSISGEPLTGIPGDWTLTWYEDVIYADIAQRDGEAYGSNFRVGDPAAALDRARLRHLGGVRDRGPDRRSRACRA